MATTLPSGVDPLVYVHPLANSWHNQRYGWHPDHRFDLLRNANRMDGGNAVAIVVHGGSWHSNDKTTFGQSSGGSGPWGYWWTGYLLNSATQGTDRIYFDVVVAEYGARAHDGAGTSGRGPTYEEAYPELIGGSIRIGIQTLPRFLTASIYDIKRLVQYLKRHAAELDINPNLIFLIGHSVGANTCMGAAFSPSRFWNSNDGRPFAPQHNDKVMGVVNMSGEVNLDPWFMFHRHAKYATGLLESDTTATGVRGDIEELFLVPDEDGLFPEGQAKTQLCKSMSPVDLVAAAPADRSATRLRSYYWKDHNAVSPYVPPGTFENTAAVAGDYAAIPPYDGSGHDWHQFAVIQAACAAKDAYRADGIVMHSGRVLDAADYYPTVATNSIIAAGESMLAETYDWMCDLIEASS